MAKIIFIGDLHLDKKPPHSTKAAAQRFYRLQQEVMKPFEYSVKPDALVQLGDVFDTFEVTSTTFTKAAGLCKNFDAIVGGNHDFSHDTTKTSALQNLSQFLLDTVMLTSDAVYNIDSIEAGNTIVYVVPYQETQQEFEKCLAHLVGTVRIQHGTTNILCLHCNYDNDRADARTENNLTSDWAKRLLANSFDFIVSGHQHNYSSHHGGRLLMAGSMLPHSFGEMSDKSWLEFDTDTGQFTRQYSWKAAGSFLQTDIEGFLSLPDATCLQFIELTGEIQPTKIRDVAGKISRLINGDSVISIKNNTALPATETGNKVSERKASWSQRVLDQLTDPEDIALFNSIYLATAAPL